MTAREIVTVCSDKGCEHKRLIVSGGLLTAPPLKVFLVSAPGEGRVWRRLSDEEVKAVLDGGEREKIQDRVRQSLGKAAGRLREVL